MATREPILVTGATGLVGRHVVRELLTRGHLVYAMARRRAGDPAAQRVLRAIGSVPISGRLEVVESDLLLPSAGLDTETARRLRSEIASVVHCAGDTSFAPKDVAEFRRTLIDGPVELLRCLVDGAVRCWVHMSTAYVCGRRTGTILESEGDVGQSFRNPYERAKLQSEHALRHAAASLGIDARILRPSIVVGAGAETLGAHPSHMFFALIRMAARLGTSGGEAQLRVPLPPHATCNIIPVEEVAASTAVLVEAPEAAGGTFHVVVTTPPTYDELRTAIADRLGVRGVRLVDPRRGEPRDATALETAVATLLAPYRDYLDHDVTFDDRATRRVLQACGVAPARLDVPRIDRLIEAALAPTPSLSAPPSALR